MANDRLGRIVAAPVASSTGAVVSNGFYVNDMVASQQIDGVSRMEWGLDPLHRLSTATTRSWDPSSSSWGAGLDGDQSLRL